MPGITWRSLAAAGAAMMVMAIHIQVVEVVLSDGSALAEQALALPAMLVFTGLLLLCALLYGATKLALLTRQELFCVLFALLLSAPMMTQGMWHRFVGIIASPARTSSFAFMDAYNDKLWPHGPNLVAGGLSPEQWRASGPPPTWAEQTWNPGQRATMPGWTHASPEDASSLTLRLPLDAEGRAGFRPGEPYLVSFLARAEGLGPDSFFYARLYADDSATGNELINSREAAKVTFIQREGFVRVGAYNVTFPPSAREYARLELGFKGTGKLVLHDPKVFSVAALEGVYKGHRIIRQSEYDKLPVAERANLIVQPDRMLSWDGLVFLLQGYIPVRDWVTTAVAWSWPIFCFLLATLALAVLMRRQWAESERYPFPLVQIPRALLGEEDEGTMPALARVWRSRWFQAGLGVALVWSLLRGWHFYNAKVPDLTVSKSLKDFLSDPGWGGMWDITFQLSAIILAFCMFFELNVLFSLVLGFIAFRALFWIGESAGLKVYTGYPFRYEQAAGAYIGYGLVVLAFTHKYLWQVTRQVLRWDRASSQGEVFSYPVAALVLLGSGLGLLGWAHWLGVSWVAIGLYFSFLLLIGFVAAKFRAECGLPGGYFTPYNAMLFVALVGGMEVFGADGVLVCLIASGFLTVSVFFYIPGTQLELLEYGRRYRIIPRHLLYTVILGIAGGLFIGGWVFLSNAYSMGGQNIRYQWAFSQDWFFGTYKQQLAAASSALTVGATPTGGLEPAHWGWIFGGGLTVLLTILRQLFAGFFFHPIGFVLGSAHMMEWAWGSALVALIVRFMVLWIGGAATVKNKLMPFFVGVFVGGLAATLIYNLIAAILRANGVEAIYGALH